MLLLAAVRILISQKTCVDVAYSHSVSVGQSCWYLCIQLYLYSSSLNDFVSSADTVCNDTMILRWPYVKENDNVLIAASPLKSNRSDFTNDRQSSIQLVTQSVKLSCVRPFDGS